MPNILYLLNDHVIKLTGLRDGKTGLYVNGAVVTATVFNHLNQPIDGIDWPIDLDYVASSDGNYEGELEEDFKASPSGTYYLVVDAETAPDVKGHWRTSLQVKERE